MYNATLNNDYDSYPSQEEYKAMMQKKGQIRYAYAGGVAKPGASFVKMLNTHNKDNLGVSAGNYSQNQVDRYANSIMNNNNNENNNIVNNDVPLLNNKATLINNNNVTINSNYDINSDYDNNNKIINNMNNSNTLNSTLINENNNNNLYQTNNNNSIVEENNNKDVYINQYKNAEAELI